MYLYDHFSEPGNSSGFIEELGDRAESVRINNNAGQSNVAMGDGPGVLHAKAKGTPYKKSMITKTRQVECEQLESQLRPNLNTSDCIEEENGNEVILNYQPTRNYCREECEEEGERNLYNSNFFEFLPTNWHTFSGVEMWPFTPILIFIWFILWDDSFVKSETI